MPVTPAIVYTQPNQEASIRVLGARAIAGAVLEDTARRVFSASSESESVRIRLAVEAILRLYRRYGFTLAQVISTETLPDGTLAITVAEGTVRRVTVQGNKRTRSATLNRLLSLKEGQVYNEKNAQNDRLVLAQSGLFDDVTVTTRLPEKSEGEKVDNIVKPENIEIGEIEVVVQVKERTTGNVSLALNYADQAGGLVGFLDLSEDNIAGTGQSASLQWQRVPRGQFDAGGIFRLEDTRQAFYFDYALPVSTRTQFGVRAYDQNTVFLPQFTTIETIRNFERRRGATVQLGQRVGAGQTLFLTSRRDQVGYDPIPRFFTRPIPAGVFNNADATVGAIGLAYHRDGRSARQNPERGFFHQIGVERAAKSLGGTRNFTQTRLDLRFYEPLDVPSIGAKTKARPVLATRFVAGTTNGSLPFSEQFFLGGSDMLRGYDFYSISGANMALASIEARVPFGPETQGVLFYDYGGAWNAGESRRLQGGIGIGARFLSPFGPIRFDLAYGKRTQTYVSLGQSF
jgi:outer membrane protein insertion porin family